MTDTNTKTWLITGASKGFGRDAVLPVRLDVIDPDAATAAVRCAAYHHFGGLDIGINNAGYGLFAMVEEVNEAQARQQIEAEFICSTRSGARGDSCLDRAWPGRAACSCGGQPSPFRLMRSAGVHVLQAWYDEGQHGCGGLCGGEGAHGAGGGHTECCRPMRRRSHGQAWHCT